MSSYAPRLQHKAPLCIGNRKRAGSKISPDKAFDPSSKAPGGLPPDSVGGFAQDGVERVAGFVGGDPSAGLIKEKVIEPLLRRAADRDVAISYVL